MNNIFSITVTYNPNLDILLKQIAQVVSQSVTVIIVDNNSLNFNELQKSIDALHFENVKIIKNQSNLGLAKAQNIGINFAIQNLASHVALFDQDSVPDDLFFKQLTEDEYFLKKKNIDISCIGPTIYSPENFSVYPFLKCFGPFIINCYQKPIPAPQEAAFIISSGSLINVKVLLDVGFMNEDFFIDYIDVEWCFRAKNKGFGCYISTQAKMSHCVGDSRRRFLWRTISEHSELRRYYLLRNFICILNLNYIPKSYKIREAFLNFARLSFSLVMKSHKTKQIKYSFKAFKDAYNGNYGKLKE